MVAVEAQGEGLETAVVALAGVALWPSWRIAVVAHFAEIGAVDAVAAVDCSDVSLPPVCHLMTLYSGQKGVQEGALVVIGASWGHTVPKYHVVVHVVVTCNPCFSPLGSLFAGS